MNSHSDVVDVRRDVVDTALRRVLDALDACPTGSTPHYADAGTWTCASVSEKSKWLGDFYDHGNWTAGFWVGILLELRRLGADVSLARAESIVEAVATRRHDRGTHDIGFLFRPSACALYDATGNDRYLTWALEAADTLAARQRSAGYLQAFGDVGDPRSNPTSTIDTMMNLPLLWWAYERTSDPRYGEVAATHAAITARHFMRSDGSTFHLVRYGDDGIPTWRGTYQGATDNSCWARGQAWAIHGFIAAATATDDPTCWNAAEKALGFYLGSHDLDELPPNDLSAPTSIRDSAAAAIVASALASSAAARLQERVGGGKPLKRILGALERHALLADDIGILGHACYSLPHRLGIDGPSPYGDYYYLRALALLSGRVVAT